MAGASVANVNGAWKSLQQMQGNSSCKNDFQPSRIHRLISVSSRRGDACVLLQRGLDKLLVDGVLEKMWTKSFAKVIREAHTPTCA